MIILEITISSLVSLVIYNLTLTNTSSSNKKKFKEILREFDPGSG